MIMCSKCKKRPAVVFITSVQGDEKKNEGLCLTCARDMHIPQVSEYMEKLGITNEEIDQLSDQMMEMLDGDSFEMGGSGIMPGFLSNIFGMNNDQEKSSDPAEKLFSERNDAHDSEEKKEKKGIFGSKREKKRRELKFLGNYCTNL